MMSLERIKELVGNPDLQDEDAEKIRDACYCMAELFLEDLREKSRGRRSKSAPRPERN